MFDWVEEFPGMISVCDKNGKVLVMNRKIADYFESKGGKKLIGSNLFDCHGKSSGAQIHALMVKEKTHIYIAEENGERELVIHAPWYQQGEFSGLVEITVPLEGDINEIKREE